MRRIRLTGQLAEPIGPFTDGVEAGGFLYVAGMLPLDANGDLVGAGDVVRQTEQVLDNVGDVLRAAGATFRRRCAGRGVPAEHGRPAGRQHGAPPLLRRCPARGYGWWRSARSPSQTHW